MRKKELLILIIPVLLFCINLHSQNIKLEYDSKHSITYDRSFPIGFIIINKYGDTLKTKGLLKGELAWRRIKVNVKGGELKKGILYVNKIEDLIDSGKVSFEVEYKKEKIKSEITLNLLFNGIEVANFKPEKPRKVKQRKKWFNFLAHWGLFGELYRGGDGISGCNGVILDVKFKMTHINNMEILEVSVIKGTNIFKYYFNPLLGKMKIIAEGGNGGNGESAKYDEKDECYIGKAGNGGDGGDGGIVSLKLNDKIKSFMDKIIISVEGGLGGYGGIGNPSGKDGINGEKGNVYFVF